MSNRKQRREEHKKKIEALFQEYKLVFQKALGDDPDKITPDHWNSCANHLLQYVEQKIALCPQKKSLYTEAFTMTCEAIRRSLEEIGVELET